MTVLLADGGGGFAEVVRGTKLDPKVVD
jgi:hypothetical protein